MIAQFATLQFSEQEATHRQIHTHVRHLIASGQLTPGTKLPSSEALSALWKTHAPTIQAALAPLVKEGLLVRRPRKGTFVLRRETKLTCLGIYCCADFWAIPQAAFQRAIYAALREELDRRGIEARVWIDSRPKEEHAKPWTELCRAAERREIQGLVAGGVDAGLLAWQHRLPVPLAFLGGLESSSAVSHDLPQLAELGLRALAEQGSRSVGLILPVHPALRDADGTRNVFGEFYKRFTDLSSDLGLAVRNAWVRVPRSEAEAQRRSQEQFGYEEFLQLWGQRERPEGLVVFPDATARGVILGLRENQVRVPEELKLVFHKNEAVELLCPMPATFLVLSEREAAQALIDQVQKQFRGEGCTPIRLSARREVHHADRSAATKQSPSNAKRKEGRR